MLDTARYVTTGADGNPEYVYSDSLHAFYAAEFNAALAKYEQEVKP